MTIKRNSFEGGTNGTNVSTSNSGGGSGDAFDVLLINNTSTPGGNSNVQYSTAAAALGSLGCRITLQASITYLRWNDSQSGTRFVSRRSLKFPSNPSADTVLITLYNGSATMASLHLDTSGRIYAKHGSTTIAGSTSSALSTNTQYFVELAATKESGGGGNGIVEYKVTDSGGSTVGSVYTSASTMSTGTLDCAQYRIGGSSTGTGWTTMDMDDLAAGPLSSGWIGMPANTAPTVDAGADQTVAASATVSLSISANDSDGSISSYATSVTRYTSGSNPASVTVTGSTTATPSWTAGSAGSLDVATVTVTDNGGATASDTVEVCVLQTTSGVAPLRGYTPVTTGTWTNTGGATSIGAALADTSDTTYAESAASSGTEQKLRTRLEPFTPRSGLTITDRLALDVSGSVAVKVRIFEDATQRQEWTVTPTTSAADYTNSLTGAISDGRKVWIERSIVSA